MRLIVIGNEEIELPQHLFDLLPTLPAAVDRKVGAQIVTEHVFPTSPKTVKAGPWLGPTRTGAPSRRLRPISPMRSSRRAGPPPALAGGAAPRRRPPPPDPQRTSAPARCAPGRESG